MHIEAYQWAKHLKRKHPEYFVCRNVLEIGSLDINGNIRHLFTNCSYTGIDIVVGHNVDILSIAHEFNPDEKYDVIFSMNALEHDMYYKKTLRRMYDLLTVNGFLFFSCSHKHNEHGTIKRRPTDSGTIYMGKEWAKFYKNFLMEDIEEIFDLRKNKQFRNVDLCVKSRDLRFWAIKNNLNGAKK